MKRTVVGMLAVMASMLVSGAAFADVTDCTSGCYITTCSGSTCTVWYCKGEVGCVVVGSYHQKAATADGFGEDKPKAFDLSCGEGSLCPIKMCSGPLCEVWGLVDGKYKPIGDFENIEYWLEGFAEEKGLEIRTSPGRVDK